MWARVARASRSGRDSDRCWPRRIRRAARAPPWCSRFPGWPTRGGLPAPPCPGAGRACRRRRCLRRTDRRRRSLLPRSGRGRERPDSPWQSKAISAAAGSKCARVAATMISGDPSPLTSARTGPQLAEMPESPTGNPRWDRPLASQAQIQASAPAVAATMSGSPSASISPIATPALHRSGRFTGHPFTGRPMKSNTYTRGGPLNPWSVVTRISGSAVAGQVRDDRVAVSGPAAVVERARPAPRGAAARVPSIDPVVVGRGDDLDAAVPIDIAHRGAAEDRLPRWEDPRRMSWTPAIPAAPTVRPEGTDPSASLGHHQLDSIRRDRCLRRQRRRRWSAARSVQGSWPANPARRFRPGATRAPCRNMSPTRTSSSPSPSRSASAGAAWHPTPSWTGQPAGGSASLPTTQTHPSRVTQITSADPSRSRSSMIGVPGSRRLSGTASREGMEGRRDRVGSLRSDSNRAVVPDSGARRKFRDDAAGARAQQKEPGLLFDDGIIARRGGRVPEERLRQRDRHRRRGRSGWRMGLARRRRHQQAEPQRTVAAERLNIA